MAGKVVMITGANSGIGEAAALELAKMGATLVMVCRDRNRGEEAMEKIKGKSKNEKVELMVADLSSMEAVRGLAREFQGEHPRLDVLINNAGLVALRRHVTSDDYETTFAVNYLSQFLLTNLLLKQLEAGAPSRVVNVSSSAHFGGHIDFDDLQLERSYSAMRAYSQSKLAVVLFTYELARRVRDRGVTANCLHPGVVATNFFRRSVGPFGFVMNVTRLFLISPKKGAETAVYLASSPEVADITGEFFYKKRPKKSDPESYDEAAAARLWTVSEQLVRPEPASPVKPSGLDFPA